MDGADKMRLEPTFVIYGNSMLPCSSEIFSTNRTSYQRVCGRARGYYT